MKGLKVLLLVLTIVLVSCSASVDEKKDETFEIGAILQLTKEGAIWGQNAKMGIELAIKEVNEEGGVLGKNLKLVLEDNQGDNPKQAVTAYNKLVQVDGINMIIGPSWSPSGLALAPLAQKDEILMISPSLGVRDFNEHGNMLFNLWPHDDVATKGLAEYAIRQGWKEVAVSTTTQAWEKVQAETFRDYFTELGGEVVAYEEALQTATDLRAEAVRIKKSDPDAVLVCNYSTLPIAMKNMRDSGVTAPFMSVLIDDDSMKAAGDYLEGTVVVNYPPPVAGFNQDFKSKYDMEPGISASTGYDAVHIIADAIESSDSFEAKTVANEINKLETYDGASGKLIFDEFGGISKPYIYQKVEDGELVTVG